MGEIINCDSVAMYREFESQPNPAPPSVPEVRHHLLDCVDPSCRCQRGANMHAGAAGLRKIALREIASWETEQRRPLPIVSGGTGLYLRALVQGLCPGPQRSEEYVANCAAAVGSTARSIASLLQRLDSSAAHRIIATHSQSVRAIEVCLASRRPMTELWLHGAKR